MGFFNFIETFFYISLGITFVLLLSLVYHFKNRLSGLEQKNETMFEIVNSMVKEMTTIKRMVIQTATAGAGAAVNTGVGISVPGLVPMSKTDPIVLSKIVEELEEEYEETDDDDDDDDDDDGAVDSVDEPEFDDEITCSEMDEDAWSEEENVELPPVEENTPPVFIKEEVLEEPPAAAAATNDATTNHIIFVPELLEPVEEVIVGVEIPTEMHEIVVNKLTAAEDGETEPVHTFDETENEQKKNNREVYRKMNVSQLRALVIAKGLITETGGLKKGELLELLDSEEL